MARYKSIIAMVFAAALLLTAIAIIVNAAEMGSDTKGAAAGTTVKKEPDMATRLKTVAETQKAMKAQLRSIEETQAKILANQEEILANQARLAKELAVVKIRATR